MAINSSIPAFNGYFLPVQSVMAKKCSKHAKLMGMRHKETKTNDPMNTFYIFDDN